MNVRRWATEKLELPADVLCRWPVITLSGRERLYVENHRGLCEYAQDKVRIKTSCGVLCICGDQMVLDELAEDVVVIIGNIRQVGYEGEA